jgi:uncharacterized protein YndB with AHSA1/START domain
VWEALTSGEISEKYFLGRRVESDWKIGSTFKMWQPDGTLDVSGKVVECDPPRKLSVTWRVEWIEELRKLPDCLVTYQIDDLGKLVRLTMTEAHQIELPDKLVEGGRRGWPVILSGLKSLLETGRPLPAFDMSEMQKGLEEMEAALQAKKGR